MQTDGVGGESDGRERCKQVVQRGRAWREIAGIAETAKDG